MKANVLHGIDHPLEYGGVEDPVAGPGEAVVKLQAASLNHRDVWIRKGQYAGLKFPIILGSDGAGTVDSVGDGVSPSWIGKSVVINPSVGWGDLETNQDFKSFSILGLPHDGTFAEKVKIPAINLYDLPTYLTPAEAATIPLAGLTAYRAVQHRGELQREETVLITGAGGGTAVFAIQIAVATEATVYVTSSTTEKIETAKSLGASGGVNYKDPEWAKQLKSVAGGFDLIIDSAGGEGFLNLVDLANPGGRIVFFGATAGNPPSFDSRRVFWKQLSILGTTMGSPSDFGGMLHFFEQHQIKPHIDRTFPLADANAALDHMDSGTQMGKIVLEIA